MASFFQLDLSKQSEAKINDLTDVVRSLIGQVRLLTTAVQSILEQFREPELKTFGGEFMFTLPNDQANVPFTISPIQVSDVEGNALTVIESFTSDNPDAVRIDGVADPASPRSGELFFGNPGIANLVYTATVRSGRKTVIVAARTASFLVTTGMPGAAVGGDIVFTGIEEDPVEPPPVVV